MKSFFSAVMVIIGLFFMFLGWKQTHYRTLYIPPDTQIHLEIAKTPIERSKGLMFRKHLNRQQGMLFIFPKPESHSFWMKNTLIHLDIIWLNDEKKIVYYQDEVPPCQVKNCLIYQPPPSIKARYVIEIRGGLREQLNLSSGQTLNF